MKKLLILAPIFFSNPALSQVNELCNFPSITPTINIIEEPIRYINNKTSAEIDLIRGGSDKNHTLGLFVGKLELITDSSTSLHRSTNTSNSCEYINKLTLTLTYHPTIYISTEASQSECILKQVYQHELKHYSFDKNALTALVNEGYIQNLIELKLNNFEINHNKSFDYSSHVNSKSTDFFNSLDYFFRSLSQPNHMSIDTTSNYKDEFKNCSSSDKRLMNLLLSNK